MVSLGRRFAGTAPDVFRSAAHAASAVRFVVVVEAGFHVQVLVFGPQFVGQEGKVLLVHRVQLGGEGLGVGAGLDACGNGWGRGRRRGLVVGGSWWSELVGATGPAEQGEGQGQYEQAGQGGQDEGRDHTTLSFRRSLS
jgi:hypothetical protein